MLILLTWCEFQKYALTSLQQLLADHPPAPEGLDPDIGTVVNKHLCLFCFFVCLFVCCFLSLLEARKASISPITSRTYLQKHYKYIFFGGGGRGITNAVQSEGENYPTLNSETTRNLYNGLLGGTIFLWEVVRKNTAEVTEDKFFPWVVFVFVCLAEVAPGEWTDDTIKLCLYLYLALLPQNHKLFHE